jgi:hypothetical protein
MDSVEARALLCSGQTGRRVGDTLIVRLESGGEMRFVEDTKSEAPGGFRYAGRIGRAPFHVIESSGHETYPTWILLNTRGQRIVAADSPIVSPDTTRFATGGTGWDNCSEANGASLDVWRLTDSLPVREWRVETQTCKTRPGRSIGADAAGGWGATNLHWRASDTLEFLRNDVVVKDTMPNALNPVEYRTRPMLAVHDRKGWRILDVR